MSWVSICCSMFNLYVTTKINDIWGVFHVQTRDKANKLLSMMYQGIILCAGTKLLNSYKNICKVSFLRNSSTIQRHTNEIIFAVTFKHLRF